MAKDAKGHGSDARGSASGMSVPDKHQHKIAVDTVKNPAKGFLGGPNAAEAETTLRSKFGYNDAAINRLKGFENEPKIGGPNSAKGSPPGSRSSEYWSAKALATSPTAIAAQHGIPTSHLSTPGSGAQVTIKHQDGEYAVPNGVGHYFTNDKADAEATARTIHGQGVTIKHRSAKWGPEMD